MASKKRTKSAAETTGNPDRLALIMRPTTCFMGDRRTKRTRTRSAIKIAAMRDC